MNTVRTKSNAKILSEILIHIIGWGLLFVLPFFLIERLEFEDKVSYAKFFIFPVTLAVVFYTNYLYLIDHFLFRKKTLQFILINLALSILVGYAGHLIHTFAFPSPPHDIPAVRFQRPPQKWFVHFLMRDFVPLVLMIGLCVAIKMTQKWLHTENDLQELKRKQAESELKNLKNQLNPHFLFNTLNNIYSLIAISPTQAQDAVMELSKLLRYVLYENTGNRVPLEKDLEFVKNYIRLMRLRVRKEVDVKVEIPERLGEGKEIAPLLFISLIENAFKHGISHDRPSFIHIRFGEDTGKSITCHIENSYFPKGTNDVSGSGIGVENLKRQLELLYPDSHTLSLLHRNDTFISDLTIHLK